MTQIRIKSKLEHLYHISTTSMYIIFIILSLASLSACNTIDEKIINSDIIIDNNTSEPGVVKFIVIGDTGHGNDSQLQVSDAINKKCDQSSCDFILLLGDNIYQSGVDSVNDEQFQTKFEIPYSKITVPFYPVLGNHDYGGNGVGYDIKKSFYQIQYSEKSSKWVMPKHYYQFNKGNTSFFALDTNAQLFNLTKDQESEIPRWIAESTSTWKIAYGHHPYKSNGPHGNAGNYDDLPIETIANGKYVKKFADNVWCGKIDIYLAGHDHSRQWLKQGCQGTTLIVSGAGSGTTKLPGMNPVLFQSDDIGFLYITITGKTLVGEFIDAHGNIEFTHTINK